MLGVDDLLAAILPYGDDPDLLHVTGDGVVHVTDAFRRAEAAWYAGVSAIAQRAPGLILDEVLLDGRSSQARLLNALADLPLVWIGVVCNLAVGQRRERLRGDRVAGMHEQQRQRVHEGVKYDYVIDTSRLGVDEAAQEVVDGLRAQGSLAGEAESGT